LKARSPTHYNAWKDDALLLGTHQGLQP